MKRSMGLVVGALVTCLLPGVSLAEGRTLYDSRILGSVPEGDRGYIEGIAFDGTHVYAGTALGSTGTQVPVTNLGEPSRIFSWNRETGEPGPTIVVHGEDTGTEHGIIGIKFDADGRLYALSNQLGLLRFTRNDAAGWAQETVVQLPDVSPCAMSAPPCSPTLTDRPPFGNDLTWGPNGALYISDSFQATIWRVTLGDAPAITPWFQSESIDRLFGPNGLRVGPDGTFMAVAVTGPDSVTVDPVVDTASRVISIPFPDPSAGEIVDLLVLPNGEYADGVAYGQDGALFVLANSADKMYIMRAGGNVDVVTNAELTGSGRMDFPASLVFDGAGALLITNYAFFTGLTPLGSRTVIDVWVNDTGLPEPPASED